MSEEIVLDPDRLLPANPSTREIARGLFAQVEHLPIVSPHGHVDAGLLRRDASLGDATTLLVAHDHYVTRLLHANGEALDRLLVGGAIGDAPAREAWRRFCASWDLFDGTASGYWLASELRELLGVGVRPSAENADALFDHIGATLARPDFRPRALFARFGIEVLATTDDVLDTLEDHAALAADPSFTGRVVPTFRPDRFIDPQVRGWAEAVDALLATDDARGSSLFNSYLTALQRRRRHFIEHGAVSADHGTVQPETLRLDPAEADALLERLLAGRGDAHDAKRFAAHMLYQMARMSVEDGLVMTIHAGVLRNHHTPTFERHGPDTGHDLPVATRFVEPLRPLLEDFGTAPGFHLVLFAVDETSWSRELAPLAGFYPSVYLGAPWWFLDAPDAIRRFREAVTETAGFSRSSGFIDDTRAFCSIPVRHDTARRVDSGYLARLVDEGRIPLARAERLIVDLVDAAPRRVFKL
ncbi:MAG: glucuronate isomerase [Cryobacterium sp.]|nr:glucuronate isomerase [Cryobacterium sp.]